MMTRSLPMGLFLCLASVLTLVAPTARALMVQLPMQRIVAESSDIVRGTVLETRSSWTDHRTTIVTDVVLRVDESWKGALGNDPVHFQVQGGVVEDIGIAVEHEPQFLPNEDVVVFLLHSPDGELTVHGAEQGKFTVVNEWIVGFDHRPRPMENFREELEKILPREDQR